MNEQRPSGIATVMFTDVEASTDITTRLGDEAAAALFATHNRIVLAQVEAHGGRDVRSTGDGFLVIFDSARAAVSCALAIQRELGEHGEGVRVRIGLNAGEVLEGGELFGAAVNLAARVMDRADGGEVLITDTVRQLVGPMTVAGFRDRGRVALKGFPERQRLYEVREVEVVATPAVPTRSRGSRRVLVVAGAAALAVVAVAVALLTRHSSSATAATVPPNAVAVIDEHSNAVVKAIPVSERPGPIAGGPGFVWALNLDSATLSRIDARTRRLSATIGLGGTPGNVVASPQEVWVFDCGQSGAVGGLSHEYTSRNGGVDLSGGDDVSFGPETTHLPKQTTLSQSTTSGCGLAARGNTVWGAVNEPAGLARVDVDPMAERSHVTQAVSLRGKAPPVALAVADGSLWAVDDAGAVIRYDERTLRKQRTLHAGKEPNAIAVGAGSVWVANEGDGSVSRIDPATDGVSQTIPVGAGPTALTVGDGAVWVASGDGSVSRIDPGTNRVAARIKVGHRPAGVAVDGGAVWVTVRQ
jgi:YVTN family beta-propeller protein